MTNYTTQCKDQLSGKVGCFLYDIARYVAEGKFYAIGPVYPDLCSFYKDHEPTRVLVGWEHEYKRKDGV